MKRSAGIALLTIALAAGAGAQSQSQSKNVGGYPGTSAYASRYPLRASDELKRQTIELHGLMNLIERKQAQVAAGTAPTEELDVLKDRAQQLQVQIASMERLVAEERRRDALQKPIDVRLKDATIRQAAEALASASRMNILVEKEIPGDLRLSVDAQAVPIAMVLQAIAGQASFQIAPAEKADTIVFKMWPTLLVNGERHILMGPQAPWSSDWGAPPTVDDIQPAIGAQRIATSEPPAGVPELPVTAPAHPGMPGSAGLMRGAMPGMMGMGGFPAGGVTLGGVGSSAVVVAEPGVGPQGEPGYWLTVYRLEGYQLKRASSLFHHLGGSQRPGMPGASPFGGGMPGATPRGAGGPGGFFDRFGGTQPVRPETAPTPTSVAPSPAQPAPPKPSQKQQRIRQEKQPDGTPGR